MKKLIFIFLVVQLAVTADQNKRVLSLRPIKDQKGALSSEFIIQLINFFQIDTFVETGTYLGDTVHNAIPLFKEIYTMELSKEHYELSCNRFKSQTNVHLYYGDSAEILPSILPKIKRKILFWLDAHCSGGNTVGFGVPIPLSHEMEAIGKSLNGEAIILIDDVRGFSGDYEKELDLNSLKNRILKINKNYIFLIFGDTAIAFLPNNSIQITPLISALTISRLFDFDETISLSDLLESEKIISKISGSEKDALLDLIKLENGYYYFWKGLILFEENRFDDAMIEFKSALKWGPNHWRIYWYWAQTAYKLGDKSLVLDLIQKVINHNPNFQEAIDFMNKIKEE
jgi:tetratricopeptide (TPR) repeat protein